MIMSALALDGRTDPQNTMLYRALSLAQGPHEGPNPGEYL